VHYAYFVFLYLFALFLFVVGFQLLAANRSWAVQYNLMKEKYSEQIQRLKEEVRITRKEKEEKARENEPKSKERSSSSLISSDIQNQINMLTHQVNKN